MNQKNMTVVLVIIVVLLVLGMLTACAGVPPGKEGSNNCGMLLHTGDSNFTHADLNERLATAFDAVSTTTDWRLNDMTDNCNVLVGYHVFVRPEPSWEDPWNRKKADGTPLMISGSTECAFRKITIGTPSNGNWHHSAIVHEIFHALQNCSTPAPIDTGMDEDHSNWVRDNIMNSVERVNR